MKRPWTKHLNEHGTEVYSPKEYQALSDLEEKATEMAELLIRLVEHQAKGSPDSFYDILLDATKLLREVGYDSMEQDPAD